MCNHAVMSASALYVKLKRPKDVKLAVYTTEPITLSTYKYVRTYTKFCPILSTLCNAKSVLINMT